MKTIAWVALVMLTGWGASVWAAQTPPAGGQKPAGQMAAGQHPLMHFVGKYDTNHDGKLDDGEWKNLRDDIEKNHPQILARLTQRFDKNGDSKLDDGEWMAVRAMFERLLERREEVIQKFDKNGDGKLDEAERHAARDEFMKNHPEIYKHLLEKFDKNGDGKLDDTEWEAARESLRERWQNHGGGAGTGTGVNTQK